MNGIIQWWLLNDRYNDNCAWYSTLVDRVI